MRVTASNRQRKIRLSASRFEREARRVLRHLELHRAELSLLFASPARMRALNREYRGVDRVTDVLSFPLHDSPDEFPPQGEFLLGDVVICPHQAARQARHRGISVAEELRRLLVHGILHLAGYDHERGSADERRMRKREEELLSLLRRKN